MNFQKMVSYALSIEATKSGNKEISRNSSQQGTQSYSGSNMNPENISVHVMSQKGRSRQWSGNTNNRFNVNNRYRSQSRPNRPQPQAPGTRHVLVANLEEIYTAISVLKIYVSILIVTTTKQTRVESTEKI